MITTISPTEKNVEFRYYFGFICKVRAKLSHANHACISTCKNKLDYKLNLEERVRDEPTPESRRSRCCGPPWLPPSTRGGLLSSGYVQSSSLCSESSVSSAADCRRSSPPADTPSRRSVESGVECCEVSCWVDAVHAGCRSSSLSSSSSRVRSEVNSESSTVAVNINGKSIAINKVQRS